MQDDAATAILDLVRARGIGKSICPTEAARALAERAGLAADAEAWRRFLPAVRAAAADLARSGDIDILRKGKPISPDAVHGVIRLRLRDGREEN